MTRPTLYLTNWSSRWMHAPGRRLCAMAAPRRWERGHGTVHAAAPTESALRLVQLTGDFAGYRLIIEDWFRMLFDAGRLRPQQAESSVYLRIGDMQTGSAVVDGDNLLCACARPGSPARKHPCHLELLAPYLVRAGWDVVLHGRRITWSRALVLDCGDMGMIPVDYDAPAYADGERAGEPMLPEDYGWPAVTA